MTHSLLMYLLEWGKNGAYILNKDVNSVECGFYIKICLSNVNLSKIDLHKQTKNTN